MTTQITGHPDTPLRTGESPLAAVAAWAVLVASFGLSAATWVALAELAGFTGHLSGRTPFGTVTIALAWLMPVTVDGYVVSALVLWMSPVPADIAAFAKKNTYAAASVGVAAQSAYHCLTVLSATHSPWRGVLAAVVGAIPPAGAALTVHMRALVRRKAARQQSAALLSTGQVVTNATDTVAELYVPDTWTAELGAAPDTRPDSGVNNGADTPDRLAGYPAHPPTDTPDDGQAGSDRTSATVTDLSARTRRAPVSADASVEALADTLTERHGSDYVGMPTALTTLRAVYGSCSKERARDAKNIHNARREATG
jgi:hypothetical protein